MRDVTPYLNVIKGNTHFSYRFKVVDLLTMASQHQNAVLEPEQERPMLEGALTFLVLLTSLRIHLGESG